MRNESMNDPYRLVTGFGSWRIGDIRVSDGPHGVRAQEDGEKNNDSRDATCFPTACCIACSWDTDLIGQMAAGIAAEAKELGVSVVLGPGVNIKRSPLCGRNFEYLSEDPYLAGTLAAAYIRSMQEAGVGTSLKHFACNNQETHRMTADSVVDERALREIYLTAFEIAVKTAQPDTVMAAYNYVNGLPACENAELLTKILREEWGFDGAVTTDWWTCGEHYLELKAGNDIKMGAGYPERVKEAYEKGLISREEIAQNAARVLELILKLDF